MTFQTSFSSLITIIIPRNVKRRLCKIKSIKKKSYKKIDNAFLRFFLDKPSRKGIHGTDDEISDDESADKEASNEDNGRKFLCDQCHKSFKYRQSLQYHIESIHLEKKNFACHICGKAFVRMQRLREHSARIHGDALVNPNHTCSECGREFITTGAWKLHMRKFHDIVVTEEQTVPHTSV